MAPATVTPDVDAAIAALVERHRAQILDVSHQIHADPEVAYEEHRAAALVADVIEAHGYAVERGLARLPTAVRGTLAGGRGPDGPTIAVLAEYDALPGLGHGCGHNLMAASGVGAAIALAGVAGDFQGRVVFLGTPAEELGSGKETMIEDGIFEGIDAAILFHPSDRTHTRVILLASEDVDVTFTGLQSHASSDPWLGRNALDAMILLFNSVGLWRQQLRPDTRVHGIITDGGLAANIIPARTAGRFMIRAADQDTYDAMRLRFEDLVRAAALATGCEGEVTFSGRSTVMRNNEVLARLWSQRMVAAGIPDGDPVPELAGSADMGNVSLVLPAIHPCVAICEEGVAGHSIAFRDASRTQRADDMLLTVSTLVAQTAWALLDDPALVAAAWQEHRRG